MFLQQPPVFKKKKREEGFLVSVDHQRFSSLVNSVCSTHPNIGKRSMRLSSLSMNRSKNLSNNVLYDDVLLLGMLTCLYALTLAPYSSSTVTDIMYEAFLFQI